MFTMNMGGKAGHVRAYQLHQRYASQIISVINDEQGTKYTDNKEANSRQDLLARSHR